ncbi:MAG: hypothetical protein ACREIA_00045 [Opitutaceae bacterium]
MKVVITDHGFPNVNQERALLAEAGAELVVAQCKTADDVIAAGRDADALLVQWAPVSAQVVEALEKCRVIVRYGIGYDNVALGAARARGIPVCPRSQSQTPTCTSGTSGNCVTRGSTTCRCSIATT